MNWRATLKDGRKLVIDCEHGTDARVTALQLFRTQRADLTVAPADPDEQADLELRWYRPRGTGSLLPEVRERTEDGWGPWTDERDFHLTRQIKAAKERA